MSEGASSEAGTPDDVRETGKRILVLATERCAGEELLDEVRYRGGPDAEVRVVAPALVSRLEYWASDEDRGVAKAEERLAASLEACRRAGMTIEGEIGDPDPLQAIEDAMRTFVPHEIIAATHPRDQANWLERDLIVQARARYDVPITHMVVDAEHDAARSVPAGDEPAEHRRERHTWLDIGFLVLAFALAVGGTLGSLLLYESDAPLGLLVAWALLMDLGLKLALIGVLWWLFLRRARADRLDF